MIIRHGSENSLDIDVYVVIEKPLINQEAKKLCETYKEYNANLITIKDGVIDWCYKGTIDECNNSIMHTYRLHKQEYENPINRLLERNYSLKMLRTIRGILSYVSRTELREDVKKALKSSSLELKLETVKKIDFNKIKEFDKNEPIEVYKFFAFQLGQTIALLKDNKELFTKNSVANYFPELKDFLMRKKNENYNILNEKLNELINVIENNYKKIDKHELYISNFNNKKEVFNVKEEKILPPVAVFDLDGTLFNEEHRKQYRLNQDWDTYFSLCDQDEPIQEIVDILKNYKKEGYEIWIMSGRTENVLQKSIDSLNLYNIPFDNIKHRANDNFLPDYVLKPAWIGKYIGKERVEVIYDDTDEVIQGFRNKGLNTIDVKNIIKKNNFKI